MKRILCLWFPLWPIQRCRAANPQLAQQRLILYATDNRQVRRVVECSEEARRLGVRPSMTLAEATALPRRERPLDRRPTGAKSAPRGKRSSDDGPPSSDSKRPLDDRWHCRPADPDADRLELRRLAELCEPFSPLVGYAALGARPQGEIGPSASREFTLLDGLFCDIGGVSSLQGGETPLLLRIERMLAEQTYHARYGVAHTIGAAWALARYGPIRAGTGHSMATDRPISTDGSISTGMGQIAASLSERTVWEQVRRMPIAALRLTETLEKTLQQLGLLWIEQLAALPREALVARLGELPVLRLDQLLGRSGEVLVPHQRLTPFVAQQSLEYPTDARGVIEMWVRHLLEQVASILEKEQRGALEIVCRLDCAASEPLSLRIGLFEPTGRVEHWMDLVRMRFEQVALPSAVHRVRVEITRAAPLRQRQGNLFLWDGEGQGADELRLFAGLVDRLSSRLGRESVWRPRLTRDPQPEQAYERVPATNGFSPLDSSPPSSPSSSRSKSSKKTLAFVRSHGPLQRPLVLIAVPRPLELLAMTATGQPLRCRDGAWRFEIARCWGPERIETGWWRGSSVRRDYYRIETDLGHRFWIFRCLRENAWFLQGEFG